MAIVDAPVAGRSLAASALVEYWQPPDVFASATPLATVLARIDAYRGTVSASYIEHVRLVADGRTLSSEATVRGNDTRYSTIIDGSRYGSGIADGTRWRQNPAGLVRTLESDLQGDPLDRWPVSTLPIAVTDCTLAGETHAEQPHWVLAVAPARTPVRWLYIDKSSGAIDRELARDGSQTFTTMFDDWREVLGARRPFHWHISGFGGPTDVYVDGLEPRTLDPAVVAIPPYAAPPLPAIVEPLRLPALFTGEGIMVDVAINGHRSRFLLDTGTTQNLVAARAAHTFDLATVLNHAVASRLDVGSLQLHDVPVMSVPEIFGIDGILGYDFFAGWIVHIDFQRSVAEIVSRASFRPPPEAIELATTFDEGVPLASASVDGLLGNRFLLDTGSAQVLLPRFLWQSRGLDVAAVGARMIADEPTRTDRFLEGALSTRPAVLPELQLGDAQFTDVPAWIEQPNSRRSIDVPFDGILGTDVLGRFEWWFDYAGGHAWVKLAR